MKFSIRLKLIAFALGIVVLVGGSISVYFIYQGRQRVFATFQKDSLEITHLISQSVVNDIYFLDTRSLRNRLENARVNPDIQYTYVMDLEGRVLSDGTKENLLRDRPLPDAFSREVLRSAAWITTIEPGLLRTGGPILTADGSRIGYLQVGFSLQRAYDVVGDATRTSLYITIICLVIGGVLAIAVSTSFTTPILSIVQTSRDIGAGKLDTTLAIKRGDELGLLSESINQMAANLKANLERIRALREVETAMTSTLDLHTVLELLLDKIDQLLPSSAVAIRLLNKGTEKLETVASRNLDDPSWKQHVGKRGALSRTVFQTKAPVMIRSIQTEPRIGDPHLFHKHGLTSYLGVPLIAHDQPIGAISLFTKEEHEFSSNEIDFFSTMAAQAAIAIQNSQLYEEIKKQAIQLEKSNKVKIEFLSVMSHELRTPLHAVIGYTWMIRDRLLGQISQEQETAVANILRRTEDLLGMINSIMEATKIEAGAATLEDHTIDLREFMDDLKSSYGRPLHKPVDVIWDYAAGLPQIKTDSGKLKHILQNLINNAIKFTAAGGITISARCSVSTETLEFKVIDTGIGIPQAAFPFIFDMFRQLDSSETRSYGGVGLGLHIVKKFTEMLGGRVEIVSELGKGSTFTVTLPYKNKSAEATIEIADNPSSL